MGTESEKCKNCKYFRAYYMGEVDGEHRFSHVCMWAFKHIEDVGAMECHRVEK